jgi:uncharacterized phage-like protein YoqJ
MIDKTVCFSGHRPEKLPGQGKESDEKTKMLKSLLYFKIRESIEQGYMYFITGLARGVDLWAAEIVLELKSDYPHIQLICAKPIKNHGLNFMGKDKYMFEHAIQNAMKVVYTSKEYHRDCYKIRNCYMVDNSSKLIALVSNYASGTGQTISYAKKCGIEVDIINANKLSEMYNEYYSTMPK